jgi:hypothetical protein
MSDMPCCRSCIARRNLAAASPLLLLLLPPPPLLLPSRDPDRFILRSSDDRVSPGSSCALSFSTEWMRRLLSRSIAQTLQGVTCDV